MDRNRLCADHDVATPPATMRYQPHSTASSVKPRNVKLDRHFG
jgi:hypothetical protein